MTVNPIQIRRKRIKEQKPHNLGHQHSVKLMEDWKTYLKWIQKTEIQSGTKMWLKELSLRFREELDPFQVKCKL